MRFTIALETMLEALRKSGKPKYKIATPEMISGLHWIAEYVDNNPDNPIWLYCKDANNLQIVSDISVEDVLSDQWTLYTMDGMESQTTSKAITVVETVSILDLANPCTYWSSQKHILSKGKCRCGSEYIIGKVIE
jgi:hypothetical protein